MSELSEQIVKLRAEGLTYQQIKDQLNCSKSTISYWLGAGQKEKNIERTRDRRYTIAKYIQQVKQDAACADCGENYPYWIMEFDHLGDKSFMISSFRGVGATLAQVVEEIEKCEIVCSNCHKDRTYVRSLNSGAHSPDVSCYYV